MYLFHYFLTSIYLFFCLKKKNMSPEQAEPRSLTYAAGEMLEPMLATIGARAVPNSEALNAQATMSRRRFVTTQCTSIFGGILFLLAVGCYSLTKIDGLSDVLLGKCDPSSASSSSSNSNVLCQLVKLLSTKLNSSAPL